ncbi:hypothetical protein CHS0354_040535, partial [Potamilus streckersoni]
MCTGMNKCGTLLSGNMRTYLQSVWGFNDETNSQRNNGDLFGGNGSHLTDVFINQKCAISTKKFIIKILDAKQPILI